MDAADSALARFVGAPGCSSSSCHGGAGEKRSQWVRWNLGDVHRRANTTLSVARSIQIAAAARIGDPASSPRCTVCHAPFADVPAALRLNPLDRTDGVSCETCHAPAEPYLRPHWRPDFTRADRTASGLRDLENLYVRANVCVACHENVDRGLIAAGHPELIFELDGQALSEPKHWQEPGGFSGAQAWLVGQAVAWREVAWYAGREDQKTDRAIDRAAGLGWIVVKAAAAAGVRGADADAVARSVAGLTWRAEQTDAVLRALAGSAADFRDGTPKSIQARRAERVVLALDRLLSASPPEMEKRVETELKELFRLAQSPPDFVPAEFAASMEKFAARL